MPNPGLEDGKKAKEQVLKWWKMFFCAIGIATTTSLKEGRALSIEDSGGGESSGYTTSSGCSLFFRLGGKRLRKALEGRGSKRKGNTEKAKQETINLQRLGVGLANLLGSVLLVVTEELGPEGNVSGLVDTVNISETSGNGEVGGDGVQSSVDVVDVWGLGVEGSVVGVGVVDTILLTSGDTDLHLEPFCQSARGK